MNEIMIILGHTANGKTLKVDVSHGGLLVVGDRGTGKSYLLDRMRDSLVKVCDLAEPNMVTLLGLNNQLKARQSCVRDVVLVVDDFDRLCDDLRAGLMNIALKGHLIGAHVIASTSDIKAVDSLVLCAFRNIVSFKISMGTGLMNLPSDVKSLLVPGEGILFSTVIHRTKFNTISTIMK